MRLRLISIVSIILILLIGFSYMSDNDKYYLSFATVQFDNEDNEIINVYHLDMRTNDLLKIAELPYYASYPNAIYDKKNNCVYYVNNQESKELNDMILKYDCSTKKSKVFISDFLRINDIFLDNNKNLCIVANTKNDSIIKPYMYNMQDKSLQVLYTKEEMCYGANYDCYNNEFIFSAFNYNESKNMMKEYNNDVKKNDNDFNIENKIYNYTSRIQHITSISTGNIPLIASNENKIIYAKYDGLSVDKKIYCEFFNNKNNEIDMDNSIVGFIHLFENDKLLCVATTINSEGIYLYDIKNKDFEQQFFHSNNETLISLHLIKE